MSNLELTQDEIDSIWNTPLDILLKHAALFTPESYTSTRSHREIARYLFEKVCNIGSRLHGYRWDGQEIAERGKMKHIFNNFSVSDILKECLEFLASNKVNETGK